LTAISYAEAGDLDAVKEMLEQNNALANECDAKPNISLVTVNNGVTHYTSMPSRQLKLEPDLLVDPTLHFRAGK